MELSWTTVSRMNPVSSYGEHAQWCCEIESQVQNPWKVGEALAICRKGLICSSTEEERRYGKFRKLRMVVVR